MLSSHFAFGMDVTTVRAGMLFFPSRYHRAGMDGHAFAGSMDLDIMRECLATHMCRGGSMYSSTSSDICIQKHAYVNTCTHT